MSSLDVLPRKLRLERRTSGTAVTGPFFYVWDRDHRASLGWARELSKGPPACKGGGMRRQRAVAERRPPQVLLAEDDAEFRALLAQAFRSRGFGVTECADGPGLVSKLGSYVLFGPPVDFDLVVSDIRMPGATALEILEAMRECEGVPPVILITAFPSEDTKEAARQLRVAAVLDKPFEIEDLVAKAKKLLAGRRGDGR